MEMFKRVLFSTVSKMHIHICVGLFAVLLIPSSTQESMFWDFAINAIASACGYAFGDYLFSRKERRHEKP